MKIATSQNTRIDSNNNNDNNSWKKEISLRTNSIHPHRIVKGNLLAATALLRFAL